LLQFLSGQYFSKWKDRIMNTTNRTRVIATGVACALWGLQSMAGNPVPKVPDGPVLGFGTADKNSDGKITKEESLLVPDLGSAFDMLDSDQDAVLSLAEFSRWSRAAKVEVAGPDPATLPGGSAGSQHMPKE
jgi:hypothetical protein